MYRLLAVIALIVILPAAAVADDSRGNADTALAGTWKLTWNYTPFGGPTTGGITSRSIPTGGFTGVTRYATSSFAGVHRRSIRARAVKTRPNSTPAILPRCETSAVPSTISSCRTGPSAPALLFWELTVTRDGRDYIAGIVHYPPALENLDPRLKRAQAIFGRYACPSSSPPPHPTT